MVARKAYIIIGSIALLLLIIDGSVQAYQNNSNSVTSTKLEPSITTYTIDNGIVMVRNRTIITGNLTMNFNTKSGFVAIQASNGEYALKDTNNGLTIINSTKQQYYNGSMRLVDMQFHDGNLWFSNQKKNMYVLPIQNLKANTNATRMPLSNVVDFSWGQELAVSHGDNISIYSDKLVLQDRIMMPTENLAWVGSNLFYSTDNATYLYNGTSHKIGDFVLTHMLRSGDLLTGYSAYGLTIYNVTSGLMLTPNIEYINNLRVYKDKLYALSDDTLISVDLSGLKWKSADAINSAKGFRDIVNQFTFGYIYVTITVILVYVLIGERWIEHRKMLALKAALPRKAPLALDIDKSKET